MRCSGQIGRVIRPRQSSHRNVPGEQRILSHVHQGRQTLGEFQNNLFYRPNLIYLGGYNIPTENRRPGRSGEDKEKLQRQCHMKWNASADNPKGYLKEANRRDGELGLNCGIDMSDLEEEGLNNITIVRQSFVSRLRKRLLDVKTPGQSWADMLELEGVNCHWKAYQEPGFLTWEAWRAM